jgi:hypothetical protein
VAFGITDAGFVLPSQADILAEIQASLQASFGVGINLAATSVFGQIAGIFSEREALIWEALQAVYASQYPAGAEGTSVDNLLALCPGIRRLQATFSKTSPTIDSVPGLVLYGTAGTVVQAGKQISVLGVPTSTFTLDDDVTIAAAVDAIQLIVFSNTPNVGAATFSILDPSGNTLTTGSLSYLAAAATSLVKFASVPVTGAFTIGLTSNGTIQTTASILYTDNAATVQTRIRALTGYSAITVSGSFAAGFTITWGSIQQPVLSNPANTLGVAITNVDSLQALINQLHDVTAGDYPYTDVTVTGNFGAGFVVTFGSLTPSGSNPSSGEQPQELLTQLTNTLQNGATVTNIAVSTQTVGALAQGIGSATATVTGPVVASANTLTVIDTPVSGWTSVNNPLAATTGTDLESDTDAIQRRQDELQANADGPIQAIVDAVRNVTGVTQVVGFENQTQAAQQKLTFSAVPTSGSFKIVLGTPSQCTGLIAYTATAAIVQTAIRLLTGYSAVIVTGSFLYGFTIDFNGANGNQPQAAVSTSTNTLDAGGAVTVTQSYGRPGKSFEIVVLGGDDADIAEAIWESKPAGIQSYGTTTETVTDDEGNEWTISFTRPTQVPIYVAITLVTDLLTAANPEFNSGAIPTIQQDVVDIGDEVTIGGLIIGFGSNGLIGAFNAVPGIVSYTMYFDTVTSPAQNSNIQLLETQIAEFSTFTVIVSYT